MTVQIFLGPEEIKEAILEYLENHRDEFLDADYSTGKKVPTITFHRNGEELTVVAARVDQIMQVHAGPHPYR